MIKHWKVSYILSTTICYKPYTNTDLTATVFTRPFIDNRISPRLHGYLKSERANRGLSILEDASSIIRIPWYKYLSN